MNINTVLENKADAVHVGNDGRLFLVNDNSGVIDLYKNNSSFNDDLLTEWVDTLRERNEQLSSRGIEYYHLPVPEKMTILHKYYKGKLENLEGSPILQLANKHGNEVPFMMNIVPFLTSQMDKIELYWKTDTHWSFWGCFSAYQLLCSRLAVDFNNELHKYPFEEREMVLNLGEMLENKPKEKARFYHLEKDAKRTYANPLVKFVEKHGLENENELREGSHVVYKNASKTAVDKSLVLFGDSFAGYQRQLLTGMLAETFREVHFIWSADIDYDYIDFVNPDIVVTELAESAMTVVPKDKLSIQTYSNNRLAEFEKDWVDPTIPVVSVIREQVVFPRENYVLDRPKSVQEFEEVEHDSHMRTNPVRVVEVEDATVYFNGEQCLVTAPGGETINRYRVTDEQIESLKNETYRKVEGTVLLFGSSPGAHCYYHWMVDLLPKFGILNKVGIDLASIDHFLVKELNGSFQSGTMERFGIDKSKFIKTERDKFLQCERLIHVELDNCVNMKMNRFVPLWLKHAFPVPIDDGDRIKLYISRPEGVRRGVSNEDELKPILEEFGYTVVVMEGMSIEDQVQLLARADVLISPHGGALTNMVFCKPGTKVCELYSRHVYPYYYGLAQMCGHEYHIQLEAPELYRQVVQVATATTVGTPDEQRKTVFEQFSVNPTTFRKTLESLEK